MAEVTAVATAAAMFTLDGGARPAGGVGGGAGVVVAAAAAATKPVDDCRYRLPS